MKNTNPNFKEKITEVIHNYNHCLHTGIGMTPTEAIQNEEDAFLANTKFGTYAKRFKTKDRKRFI